MHPISKQAWTPLPAAGVPYNTDATKLPPDSQMISLVREFGKSNGNHTTSVAFSSLSR